MLEELVDERDVLVLAMEDLTMQFGEGRLHPVVHDVVKGIAQLVMATTGLVHFVLEYLGGDDHQIVDDALIVSDLLHSSKDSCD